MKGRWQRTPHTTKKPLNEPYFGPTLVKLFGPNLTCFCHSQCEYVCLILEFYLVSWAPMYSSPSRWPSFHPLHMHSATEVANINVKLVCYKIFMG